MQPRFCPSFIRGTTVIQVIGGLVAVVPLLIHGATNTDGTIAPELKMLSITAAHTQQPNLTTSGESSARNVSTNTLTLTEAVDVQTMVVSRTLHVAKNPEEMAEEIVAVPWESAEISEEDDFISSVPVEIAAGDSDPTVANTPITIPGPASLLIAEADIIENKAINPDIVDKILVVEPAVVASIAELPHSPKGEHSVFVFTGKEIPTTQQLLTSEGEVIDEREIDEAPILAVSEETGGQEIRGACGDAYYVVLLYADVESYERDPESYILERTYECNGVISYPLSDLPASLPNGTYYLLLGEQGTFDTWLPTSSLVEFTINRN